MTTADRDFFVYRRRPRLVDIITPRRPNVQGYRLKAALNFDAVFNTILTADIGRGYLDPVAVRVGSINPQTIGKAAGDHIRIVFDPVTFAGAPTNLDDDQHIWLQWFPVNFAGVEGAGGPRTLILPYDELSGTGRLVISGDALMGVSVADSRRLDLPFSAYDVVIKNNEAVGGNNLQVATFEGAPEITVSPQENTAFQGGGGVGTLMVRGSGGVVSFTAHMSRYLAV